MHAAFGSKRRRDAQTLVFFLLAWGTIMLLCGLAIDSGLLYLAKARLGRAVDGASLAAVGNFNRSSVPTTNRDDVALIMRNFAVANFTDLGLIGTVGSTTSGGTPSSYTLPNGTTATTYTYNFNDGTEDPNGQYRRYVQVVLNTGSGGAITSATCNARCPVQTYFIGYATYAINGRQNVKIGGYSGPTGLMDLKVSSTAVATRNPRLIMIVIDRSASMLQLGGGASGLPPAVVQFLDFFDTSSDNIGIVSFGTAARLEMPMTTNFIIAGTNNLIDAYNSITNSSGVVLNAEPGLDPEDTNAAYATTGVRRLKFGGSTAADDGIRMAMEQLMANAGFNDPDVVKYMVIFTDGKWNTSRTLLAAPGYTNEVTVPTADTTHVFSNNYTASITANGGAGAWNSTNLAADTNLVPVPTLSPLPYVTNAIAANDFVVDYANLATNHLSDTWLSADGTANETLASPGTTLEGGTGNIQGTNNLSASQSITNTTWVGRLGNSTTNFYTHYVDVWLQPGAVAYYYASSGATPIPYVSDYTAPAKHINLNIPSGGHVDLVVPGYIVDGTIFDGLDLCYPDNPGFSESGYPRYRNDNFQQAYMWNDDTIANAATTEPYVSNSMQRQLMFRNYVNLLTGFYVSRPNYPTGTGYEPLITELNPPGAPRSLDGLGPYYPGAAFYWPFDLTGVSWDPTYSLINPVSDPTAYAGYTGQARHNAYSINMLSTNAAPAWAGELFYKSTSGGGTNVVSGTSTTSASQVMQSADWQTGKPAWMSAFDPVMTNEPTHNTNISGSPSVWRPLTFNGSLFPSIPLTSVTPGNSSTGGYVSDGAGHYFKNAMAWSGRPTHYYDFSQATWVRIVDNHTTNIQALPLGNWKAQEYAWHARALGVTIYTIGYGTLVNAAQCSFLAQIANSTNVISPGSPTLLTNPSTYNPNQPIGQQFYATTAAQISNDFYSVGQAISAALTQ